jgi:hypothetical protein
MNGDGRADYRFDTAYYSAVGRSLSNVFAEPESLTGGLLPYGF